MYSYELQRRLEIAERERDELLAALKALYGAIDAVRSDLGTSYPALSEAWFLAGGAIAKADSRS